MLREPEQQKTVQSVTMPDCYTIFLRCVRCELGFHTLFQVSQVFSFFFLNLFLFGCRRTGVSYVSMASRVTCSHCLHRASGFTCSAPRASGPVVYTRGRGSVEDVELLYFHERRAWMYVREREGRKEIILAGRGKSGCTSNPLSLLPPSLSLHYYVPTRLPTLSCSRG